MKNILSKLLVTVLLISNIFATTKVSGSISNEAGEAMIGVNVFVEDKYIGTATDTEGNYSLTTDLVPPFTLVISAIGYTEQKLPITEVETSLSPVLIEKPYLANDIVVSASRIKESYLSAPVSIEKMDILDVRRTPSASFYESLDNMRGVELKTTSIFNQSVTGRGFGNTKNTNFIQLIDGANNAPLANGSFAIGNLLGIPELDIASIEVMPGASSALYGPNAYSGIMHMNSKTPFFYQGLSAQVKTGTTNEDVAGSNPHYNVSARYAKAYEKLAYKFTIDYAKAYDWGASNESYVVWDYTEPASGKDIPIGITSTTNKVNLYGDEYPISGVSRTPYHEKVLVDYNVDNTKLNTTVEYKLTDDLLASYSFRNAIGSSNFQSINKYMLENITATYNQFQLNGPNYHLRGYVMNEDAGDSYDAVFAAWNVNRAAKNDLQWFTDYFSAYTGGLAGMGLPIAAADHSAARDYADNGVYLPDGTVSTILSGMTGLDDNPLADAVVVDGELDLLIYTPYQIPTEDLYDGCLSQQFSGCCTTATGSADCLSDATAIAGCQAYLGTADVIAACEGYSSQSIFTIIDPDATPRFVPGTPEFKEALKTVKGTKSGAGAGFVSTSTIYDFEGMYDFENRLGFVNLLVGGSYKMYKPFTKGSIYSDSDETVAEHGKIELNEFAAFGQISKSVLNNSLKLQATIRYDGHSNFETNVSPRFSGVYSLNDFQHIRASYQSGFANPTVQDQYLDIDLGAVYMIGGIEENVKRLGLTQLFTEGVIENDDGTFETVKTDYLHAEYQTSYEVGYKGLLSKNLYIDVNYYASEYTEPQVTKNVYDVTTCTSATNCSNEGAMDYNITTNKTDETDKLHGAGTSITYNFNNGYRVGGSYEYTDMTLEPAKAFNWQTGRPKNRIKLSVSNPNVINNLGFSVAARYSSEYFYTAGPQFGGGTIDAQTIMDAQFTYTLQQYQTSIKLGINNLLGTSYTQALGGPSIGQTMYVTFTFDNMFN